MRLQKSMCQTRKKFSKCCLMCTKTSGCHLDKFTGGSASSKLAKQSLGKVRSGAPHTTSTDAIIAKTTVIIINGGLFSIQQFANLLSISSWTVFTILKKQVGLRNVRAKWIPHL